MRPHMSYLFKHYGTVKDFASGISCSIHDLSRVLESTSGLHAFLDGRVEFSTLRGESFDTIRKRKNTRRATVQARRFVLYSLILILNKDESSFRRIQRRQRRHSETRGLANKESGAGHEGRDCGRSRSKRKSNKRDRLPQHSR